MYVLVGVARAERGEEEIGPPNFTTQKVEGQAALQQTLKKGDTWCVDRAVGCVFRCAHVCFYVCLCAQVPGGHEVDEAMEEVCGL